MHENKETKTPSEQKKPTFWGTETKHCLLGFDISTPKIIEEQIEDITFITKTLLFGDTLSDADRQLITENEKAGELSIQVLHEVLKGRTIREVMHYNDDYMEGFYTQGYQFYRSGKYDNAYTAFEYLNKLDPWVYKYHFGMCSAAHMDKRYADAAQLYYRLAVLHPDRPEPLYHSIDCYLQLGDPISALGVSGATESRAKNKPEYAEIYERCKMISKTISDTLEKNLRKGDPFSARQDTTHAKESQ